MHPNSTTTFHFNTTSGGVPLGIPRTADLSLAPYAGKTGGDNRIRGVLYTKRDAPASPASKIRKEREARAGMVSKTPPRKHGEIFEFLNDWARELDRFTPAVVSWVGGSEVPAEGHCSVDGVCTAPAPLPDVRRSVSEFVKYVEGTEFEGKGFFEVALSSDLYDRYMAGTEETLSNKVVLMCDTDHSDMELQAHFEDFATEFFVHPRPSQSIKGDEMLAESPGTVCTSESWGKGTNSPCVLADDEARQLAAPEYSKAADLAEKFLSSAQVLGAKMPKKQPNMGNALLKEAAKWVEPARSKLRKGSKVLNAAEGSKILNAAAAFEKQLIHAWNTVQKVDPQREQKQAQLALERAQDGITVFETIGEKHCPTVYKKLFEAGKDILTVTPPRKQPGN
jgi:hypothetical protein